ncbi:M56 family metallopeptidase [Winogradskyella sediminis]|uniref:M56 family metallopeptidase n=1 Tax=Winogradskyella sediminis TaxID=1382466 RepID=UPI003AA99DE6
MEYLLKASTVIVLMYFFFHIFLKKETFFEHNRWFLLTGLLLALILPLIVIPIYVPIPPIVTPTTTFISAAPSNLVVTEPAATFNWLSLIPIVYGIGLTVFVIQFILQFSSLILLLLKNPKRKDQQYTYVIVNNKISPFSFFKWIVYNPDAYKAEELQLIIAHEKVHVNQWHSIDILLTQLACVIFWFNPLIWYYRKEVRQNLEYIADLNCQNSPQTKKDYQHLLLKTSVANHSTLLSNNFYNSSIKKRILMLNKSRSNKKNQFKYLLILPLLAGLLMSMNTKEVYIEHNLTTKSNSNILEPVVTKNTSDVNLEGMTNVFEKKGIHNDDNYEVIDEQETPKDSIISERLKLKFTNQMNDQRLSQFETLLKPYGVSMKIKRIKRNHEHKISDLNIQFKSKNSIANHKAKDKDGIRPFFFEMTNEEISINTLQEAVQIEETIMVYDLKEPSSNKTSNDTLYYKIVRPSTHIQDSIYMSIDSSEVKRLSKEKSDLYYEGGKTLKVNDSNEEFSIHQPATNYKIITNSGNLNPKPLVIVNGKEVSSNFLKSISTEIIESMTVIKGDDALSKYGEKGKNGVIELITKESVAVTKKDNPWKIGRTEVSSVTFIDDEDPSKNATIAYISKYTPDTVLEDHKVNLEKIGITVKYSKLKRNKAGEITSIKISLDNKEGSKTSATWKDNDGIQNIEYGISEGKLITRTKQP